MANFGANLSLIQVHLPGKDEEEIERLQWFNNLINQTKYNYSTPVQKKNGKWVVWFYADIREWKDPRELKPEDFEVLQKFGE